MADNNFLSLPNNNIKSNNQKIDLHNNVSVIILAGMALHMIRSPPMKHMKRRTLTIGI